MQSKEQMENFSVSKACYLSYPLPVVLSVMQLEPRNATVLLGDEVRFNCTTNELWDVMVWQHNGRSVLTISSAHGPLGHGNYVWAENRSTSAVSMWELVLRSSTFSPTIQEITCELLPGYNHRQTAGLSVQEYVPEVEGRVVILGGNVSAQVGAPMVLHCQAVGWYPAPAIEWRVNDATVNSSEFNSSSIQDQAGLFNITSTLQLRVEEMSRVQCSASVPALPAPRTSSVFISAVPTENHSVVIIAVTVTVCIIAMVALITVILLCRHKLTKSKLFQDQLRFDQQKSEKDSEEHEGKVNFGYNSEGPPGFGYPHQAVTETTADTRKVPDIIYIMSHEPRQASAADYANVPRREGLVKIRQSTTV
ncbi:hypothetical protein NFI96_033127 [Prochilodus magdalenae]|nr:hypothetical protein NFI96_033127 [Prochilodus magdalenae]